MNDSKAQLGDNQRSNTRPVIGVTTYLQPASWGAWSDVEAALIPAEYARMVTDAGGTPVLLPPVGTDLGVLDRLDGLILSGGADVGPGQYGAEADPRTQAQAWRDDVEFALFAAAHAKRVPVLGICRGLQVINVALGGTLYQHVPDVLGHSRYQPVPGVYGEVTVEIEPGSTAHSLLGANTVAPCYHHQAVDQVAPSLKVTGRSADGVVEVLERDTSTEGGWLLCVQWHPEHNSTDARVVVGLVAAARDYRQELMQTGTFPANDSHRNGAS